VTELPGNLRDIVTQLKEPVTASAGFRERVMNAVRATHPRRPLAWIVGGVLAAGVALFLLFHPRSDTERPTTFLLLAPRATTVALVGDFNDWDPSATPLQSVGDSAWFVVVSLKPGRYRYSFVVDGQRWMADPTAARAVDHDFGPESSVVTVLSRRT